MIKKEPCENSIEKATANENQDNHMKTMKRSKKKPFRDDSVICIKCLNRLGSRARVCQLIYGICINCRSLETITNNNIHNIHNIRSLVPFSHVLNGEASILQLWPMYPFPLDKKCLPWCSSVAVWHCVYVQYMHVYLIEYVSASALCRLRNINGNEREIHIYMGRKNGTKRGKKGKRLLKYNMGQMHTLNNFHCVFLLRVMTR